MYRVGCIKQPGLCVPDGRDGVVGIAHAGHMHLADQQRAFVLHLKATCRARHCRCTTQTGNNGRLFNNKRHDVLTTIDHEVRSNREWQAEYTNHVFDHAIGGGGRQHMAAIAQPRRVSGRHAAQFLEPGNAIRNTQPVEASDTGVFHAGSRRTPSGSRPQDTTP